MKLEIEIDDELAARIKKCDFGYTTYEDSAGLHSCVQKALSPLDHLTENQKGLLKELKRMTGSNYVTAAATDAQRRGCRIFCNSSEIIDYLSDRIDFE